MLRNFDERIQVQPSSTRQTASNIVEDDNVERTGVFWCRICTAAAAVMTQPSQPLRIKVRQYFFSPRRLITFRKLYEDLQRNQFVQSSAAAVSPAPKGWKFDQLELLLLWRSMHWLSIRVCIHELPSGNRLGTPWIVVSTMSVRLKSFSMRLCGLLLVRLL